MPMLPAARLTVQFPQPSSFADTIVAQLNFQDDAGAFIFVDNFVPAIVETTDETELEAWDPPIMAARINIRFVGINPESGDGIVRVYDPAGGLLARMEPFNDALFAHSADLHAPTTPGGAPGGLLWVAALLLGLLALGRVRRRR